VTVIIDMGGNDAGVEIASNKNHVALDTYIANMQYCIAHAKEKGYEVVCLGLGSYDESRTDPILWDTENASRNAEAAKYDDALRALTIAEGVLYISTKDLFASRPEFLLDGDHPNAEGHKLIFERVKEHLEKAKII
jgi:lysophospholipase L1-like esterase